MKLLYSVSRQMKLLFVNYQWAFVWVSRYSPFSGLSGHSHLLLHQQLYWNLWTIIMVNFEKLMFQPSHLDAQKNSYFSVKSNLRLHLICFSLLCSVIDSENLHQALNQSDAELKPISTWSCEFSNLRQFGCFYSKISLALKGTFLSSNWLLQLL